jgi:hypothetical protein
MKCGKVAVEPLVKATSHKNLEVAVRAVLILKEIYISGDDSAVESAEAALEKLKESKNRSISGRAAAVLNRYYLEVGRKRAIAAIRKFAGHVEFDQRSLYNPLHPNTLRIRYVLVDENWTGGDKGIEQIKRLTTLGAFYVIDGAKISEDGIQGIQKAIPNVIVQRRGRSYLGISGLADENGCLVGQVNTDTAAERAKLRAGDVITHFGGEKVTSFEQLVTLIKKTRPGNKLEVKLLRGGDEMTKTVVMDSWVTKLKKKTK